jgi:hypothetical protein
VGAVFTAGVAVVSRRLSLATASPTPWRQSWVASALLAIAAGGWLLVAEGA